jgi:SAM-dependent methyltransferase
MVAPMAALPPPDARRAAFRTRDAVRAAFARPEAAPARSGAVAVELAEPEVAIPVAGLARALAAAAARPETPLAPGGGWAGAPFPAAEPYVASWELHLAAERRAAAPAERSPAGGEPPATLRPRGAGGPAQAFAPWLVHSFAGRKGHPRPDVLALVPPSARSVLDVGCGEGALGAGLEARGARVTGIELDAQAAEVASRRLSRVLPLRAEEALAALDARPDVVVLADVLEHLLDPASVLRAARAVLRPGGTLVFSVPNATHASVLGGAFRGRWERELEGTVADDHRLYAGRAGWLSLLSACGFRVTSLRAAEARTPFSAGDREVFLAASGLPAEELDAVQWLGTAEPTGSAGATDARGAVEEDGPLGAEDPVGECLARSGAEPVAVACPNPVRAALLETLLGGGLVSGAGAVGLLSGWTPAGLARRFEGSGLVPEVRATSVESLPGPVRAVVEARHRAGLPTDGEAISAAGWRVAFRRVPAGSGRS